jgi:hypothetical protein
MTSNQSDDEQQRDLAKKIKGKSPEERLRILKEAGIESADDKTVRKYMLGLVGGGGRQRRKS